jgi:Fe-S-cluster containining protein
VSFYWAEAEVNRLPDELVEKVTPVMACMAGTQDPSPRCHALDGAIGEGVSCRIYGQRPGPCRELEAGDDKCRRARERHGLAPLAVLRLSIHD